MEDITNNIAQMYLLKENLISLSINDDLSDEEKRLHAKEILLEMDQIFLKSSNTHLLDNVKDDFVDSIKMTFRKRYI